MRFDRCLQTSLSNERRFEALLGGSAEDQQMKLQQFNSHYVSLKPLRLRS